MAKDTQLRLNVDKCLEKVMMYTFSFTKKKKKRKKIFKKKKK